MQQWRDSICWARTSRPARTLFADDPVLAMYQGTLRQTFGDPRLHDYLRKRGSTEGMGQAAIGEPQRRFDCRRRGSARCRQRCRARRGSSSGSPGASCAVPSRSTRRCTRRASAWRTSSVGWATIDRRSEVVRPALEAPLPPFLEFYAALILGRSEEQLGHFDEAGVAYARAAARFPGAESAEIGRSRVALAQGRAPDALKILGDAVGPILDRAAGSLAGLLEAARP